MELFSIRIQRTFQLVSTMEQQIQANYRQIKQDIVELVENELIRIENDPKLKYLLGDNENNNS